MRYKHDSMLPLGAFQQRGSVVGGRSMRLHGGGYEASEEDWRLMQVYDAARSAGQSQAEANRTVMQSAMEATYSAPQAPVADVGSYTPVESNWTGTPTVYANDQGVQAVLTQNGYVSPSSLNPIIKPGEKITANTPVQAVNEEGLKLYLRDANDPSSWTTTITGIPAVAGTIGEVAYQPPRNNSPFGTIGSDFAGMAKDPAFWKFLASAAALGTGAYLAPALEGAGAVATAFPVEMGGLLPATELGAIGGTAASAAGGMSAAEALALASEGGLGAEFGVQGALGGSSGGLGSLFAGLGSNSLLQGGLALGGLAALNALAPKQGSTGGSSAPTGLSSEQLKAIVSTMPSAMGNYLNMAGNPYGYGGGTIDSANANLANLFPGFSLPTVGPYFGAGRFGDYYAPQAASTTPISPTGLV